MILHDVSVINLCIYIGLILLANVLALGLIILTMTYCRGRIKWKEWRFAIIFLSTWFIFIVPFNSIANVISLFKLRSLIENESAQVFDGRIYKLDGRTTGVKVYLDKTQYIFADKRIGCFSSFNKKSGFHISGHIHMEYYPLSSAKESVYCVTYLENK